MATEPGLQCKAYTLCPSSMQAEEEVKLDVLCEAVKDVGEKYWSKIQFKRGEPYISAFVCNP